MSKNKDKKEKPPVIVKVSPDETYVENNKKSLTDKFILTIDSDENASSEDYDACNEDYDGGYDACSEDYNEGYDACSEDYNEGYDEGYDACSEDYNISSEGSNKKEITITTNFATPPCPKK